MQTAAGDAVCHVAAQFTVSGTGVHVRTASPVTEGIDLRLRVCSTELHRWRIALADDQALAVQNVFPITTVLGIDVLGDAGQLFLLPGHRHTFEDAIVAAAETVLLIPGQMAILRHLDVIHGYLPGDALDSGSHFEDRQGDVRLHNDVADAVAQKNLHGDTGIVDLGVSEIDQRSGNAVTQLVGMGGVDFFKHNDSPSIAEAPEVYPRGSCAFFHDTSISRFSRDSLYGFGHETQLLPNSSTVSRSSARFFRLYAVACSTCRYSAM